MLTKRKLNIFSVYFRVLEQKKEKNGGISRGFYSYHMTFNTLHKIQKKIQSSLQNGFCLLKTKKLWFCEWPQPVKRLQALLFNLYLVSTRINQKLTDKTEQKHRIWTEKLVCIFVRITQSTVHKLMAAYITTPWKYRKRYFEKLWNQLESIAIKLTNKRQKITQKYLKELFLWEFKVISVSEWSHFKC